MDEHIIVTRHVGLAQYIIAKGIAPAGTPVISHARPKDVRGKHVYGVLPLRLAHLAKSVTEVPILLADGDRGSGGDVSYRRMCEIAMPPVTLKVEVISGRYDYAQKTGV